MTLSVEQLECGYRNHVVLHGVDCTLQPGEILAIVGPNGCGKTTLLRAMARLLHPHSGSVMLDGSDIRSMSANRFARSVALMPQAESPDWPLTVREVVELGRTPHRGAWLPFSDEDRAVVRRVLAHCDLDGLAHRRVTELSGGEWRRVMLGRTLAQTPRVMLLDEPTSQLDLRHQIQLLDNVQAACRQQSMAVAMTIHDLHLATMYADRFALLCEGRLVGQGSAEEVLEAELLSRVFGLNVEVVRHPDRSGLMIVPTARTATPP